MSAKANHTLIGAFVLGAAILAAAGVILFGRGTLFQEKIEFVMHFDESIGGLDVGAPVEFQGVRVGTVTDVRIELDQSQKGAVFRPVKAQVEGNRIVFTGQDDGSISDAEYIENLVTIMGLRARLAGQSMLTGKLKIELGYYPNEPVNRKNRDPGIWEMPTMPSQLKRVADEIEQLPLADIVAEIHRAAKGLSDILSSDEVQLAVKRVNGNLERMDKLLATIEGKIDPLADQSMETLEHVQTSLNDLSGLIEKLSANVEPLMKSLTESAQKAGRVVDEQLRSDISGLIGDLRDTAKSIRFLADYLEKHPESLLQGKK